MIRITGTVLRNPWRIVIGAAVLAAVAAVLGGPVQGVLSPGGFTDPGSQSQVALRQIAAAAHVSPDQSVVAMVSPAAPARTAAGAAEVAGVRRMLAADPAIATVTDASSGAPLLSRDGARAYVVAALRPMSDRDARDVAERVEASFATDPRVILGGFVIANQQGQAPGTYDLGRAVLIAAPVLARQCLSSIGIGGLRMTLTAAVIAGTLAPSMLLLLGRRIDMPPLRREPAGAAERSGWYRLSHGVMRRPATVPAATTVILLLAGMPFLGVRFTSIDAGVLPQSASARQVDDAA